MRITIIPSLEWENLSPLSKLLCYTPGISCNWSKARPKSTFLLYGLKKLEKDRDLTLIIQENVMEDLPISNSNISGLIPTTTIDLSIDYTIIGSYLYMKSGPDITEWDSTHATTFLYSARATEGIVFYIHEKQLIAEQKGFLTEMFKLLKSIYTVLPCIIVTYNDEMKEDKRKDYISLLKELGAGEIFFVDVSYNNKGNNHEEIIKMLIHICRQCDIRIIEIYKQLEISE